MATYIIKLDVGESSINGSIDEIHKDGEISFKINLEGESEFEVYIDDNAMWKSYKYVRPEILQAVGNKIDSLNF
jgi:hypothetical protein